MGHPLANVGVPIRGSSRFRVKIVARANPPKPYTWEIYDEVRDRCVGRSAERYRSPGEAWEAGSRFLAGMSWRVTR